MPKRVKPTRGRTLRKPDKWSAATVLSSEKSPLADADLRDILCHPNAWTALTAAERAEILALFPDDTHILEAGTPQARPNVATLLNDDNFRHDCARYTSDLGNGLHDAEWLAQAFSAHLERAADAFAEFEVRNFEAEWGIEVPAEYLPASMKVAVGAALGAGAVDQANSSEGLSPKVSIMEKVLVNGEDKVQDEIQVKTTSTAIHPTVNGCDGQSMGASQPALPQEHHVVQESHEQAENDKSNEPGETIAENER